jgi:hypothetical protein
MIIKSCKIGCQKLLSSWSYMIIFSCRIDYCTKALAVSHLRQPSWPGAHPSPAWQSSGDSPWPPARSAAAGRRRGTARGGSGSPGLARPPGTTARGKGRGFHRETMRNHGEMAIDGENGGYWRMITTFSTCPMDFLGLTSGFRQQLSVKMGISQGQLVI